MLKATAVTASEARAHFAAAPTATDRITNRSSGCIVGLSSVVVLLLSRRILTRVDVWSSEWDSTLASMSPVHRAAVSAFMETISKIDDVCVDDQMLHRE